MKPPLIALCLCLWGCGNKAPTKQEPKPAKKTPLTTDLQSLAKTVKELTPEDVIGTYLYTVKDDKTNKAVFMKKGELHHYGWDKQNARLKWEITNFEVLITGNFGTFFCRKEIDGKLTQIAEVKDEVRTELPEKEQISGTKIK